TVGDINLTNNNGYSERIIKINSLYVVNPDLMLGEPCYGRGHHEKDEFILKDDGRNLSESLAATLIRQLPANGYRSPLPSVESQMTDSESDRAEFQAAAGLDRFSGLERVCVDELLEIYVAAKDVIRLQMHDASDEELTERQHELSHLYNRFRMRFGCIDK